MQKPVWNERFHIRTQEADGNGLARLDALFGCFAEAAGHHAQHLGVGRADLLRRNCFWVLSRCAIQIDRYPPWGREITVRTWPRGVERLFAMRHFQFLLEDGATIGSGVSAWLILDLDRRRPVRPDPFLRNLPSTETPSMAGDVLEKPATLQALAERRRFCVRYSELDVNRHVNNAVYVRWILDSFDAQTHDRFQIGGMRIDYLSETVMGETILVQTQEVASDGGQAIVGVRPVSRQPVFQARIVWRAHALQGP